MNTNLSSLKSRKDIIGLPDNTNDLINGLFLTVNTVSKDFDYANAYEILPEIVSSIYDCIDSKPYSLKPNLSVPTEDDIEFIAIASKILILFSIGLNKDRQKNHIHAWIFNLHSFTYDYKEFCIQLKKNLKNIRGISKRNEFSVKLIPCTDPVDSKIRESNYNYKVVSNYIKDREYNTLMNYFSTKNSKDFIYFY